MNKTLVNVGTVLIFFVYFLSESQKLYFKTTAIYLGEVSLGVIYIIPVRGCTR